MPSLDRQNRSCWRASSAISTRKRSRASGGKWPAWRCGTRRGRRPLAVRALEVCRAQARQGDQAWALRLLGEIHAYRQPPQAALAAAAYREALALAEALSMRPLQAHCHRGLGILYATTGQQEQARTAVSMATAMYQSMEMTFWLPQIETVLAQIDA